jgi:hypothetical protein
MIASYRKSCPCGSEDGRRLMTLRSTIGDFAGISHGTRTLANRMHIFLPIIHEHYNIWKWGPVRNQNEGHVPDTPMWRISKRLPEDEFNFCKDVHTTNWKWPAAATDLCIPTNGTEDYCTWRANRAASDVLLDHPAWLPGCINE